LDTLAATWNHPIGSWTVGQLISAFFCLAAGFILRAVIISWFGRRVRRLAERTASQADDVAVQALIGPLSLFALLLGIYFAGRILTAGYTNLEGLSATIAKALIILLLAWMAYRLIDAVALYFQEKAAHTETRFDDQIVPLLRKAAKVFVGILAFVLVVQNLGYSVSGLLAGLGIGGLAFALAAKDTIANLFGSVTILIDRPFRVGDWISVDDSTEGVVEEIGLRSTRIRTFAKTLVSIPNQSLANAQVNNHSLMPRRRIKMTVGVTYDTRPDQMREAVRRIEGWIRGHQGFSQDFMLIKFTDFAASSLDIFVYCFTVTTDWSEYLSLRQELNLAIMDILAEVGLSIAFPTRTVHLVDGEPDPAESSPRNAANTPDTATR
jgi:MscS family membrane protein